MRSGNATLAAESFKKAAKLSPKKGLYFKELAISLFRLNEYEKVISVASKAKELGKTDSVIYAIWGKSLYETGDINESIIMLDHALKSNKNNLLAKYFLAESLVKAGDHINASGYIEEILHSKAKTPLKQKSEILLKKISDVE